MGVHGLWQLLQPSGRPVSLESLEGKILAVDVSIWLHQTLKGMRDKDGNPLPNAHLQGLFTRVCKLLYYKIKPVFVFDGGVPVLKKQTLAARRERKADAERESSDIAQKLLNNLIRSQAVKGVLGAEASSSRRVPGIRKGRDNKDEDMFALAPLPEDEEIGLNMNAEEWEREFEQQENWIKEGLAALGDVHPDSDEFKSLPMEIQHEVLSELKERRKYHTLSRLTKMPEESDDFSTYQLKKLMKQSRLTNRIETIKKDMGNKTTADLAYSAGEDYYGDDVEARRIVSEDTSHYVLIKGLTKKKQEEEAERFVIESAVKKEEADDDDEYATALGMDKKVKKEKEEETGSKRVTKSTSDQPAIAGSDSDSDREILAAVCKQGRRRGRRLRSRRSSSASTAGSKNSSSKTVDGIETSLMAVEEEEEEGSGSEEEEEEDGGDSGSQSGVGLMDSSSSEDEGFIEISVDPSAPIVEDELFPAGIFDQCVSDANNAARQGEPAVPILPSQSGKRRPQAKSETAKKAGSRKVLEEEGEGKRSRGLSHNPPEIVPDKEKSSVGAAEAGKPVDGQKRKTVMSDILKELQLKKQKLVKSLEEEENLSDVLDERGTESMDEKDQSGSSSSSEICETESSAAIDSEPIVTRADSGAKGMKKVQVLSESEEDEDLKLAIELSLQTAKCSSNSGTALTSTAPSTQLAVQQDRESSCSREEPTIASSNSSRNPMNRSRSDQAQEVGKGNDDRGEDVEMADDSSHISAEESQKPPPPRRESFNLTKELQNLEEEEENREEEDNEEAGGGFLKEVSEDESAGGAQGESKEMETEALTATTSEDRLQPEDFEEDQSYMNYAAWNETELLDFNTELDSERSALILERGRQNRMAASVTDQVNQEAQELLRLFGIPYVVSPMEAEAQCAYLDISGQTDGTITDDSDIWLFGGCRMYKNFFNQNKHVEFFSFERIVNHFGMGRDQLINIALLCGSDYTEGIQGVGPVRALEIMAEFPGNGLDGLSAFKKWWEKMKKKQDVVVGNKIRDRLKKLALPNGFPSEAVVRAYTDPSVDESRDAFSWKMPDLDTLREFAKLRFGWGREKSDQSLLPMMKQLSERKNQGRIHSYFQPEMFIQSAKIKSDRLKKALSLVKSSQSGGTAHDHANENEDGSGDIETKRMKKAQGGHLETKRSAGKTKEVKNKKRKQAKAKNVEEESEAERSLPGEDGDASENLSEGMQSRAKRQKSGRMREGKSGELQTQDLEENGDELSQGSLRKANKGKKVGKSVVAKDVENPVREDKNGEELKEQFAGTDSFMSDMVTKVQQAKKQLEERKKSLAMCQSGKKSCANTEDETPSQSLKADAETGKTGVGGKKKTGAKTDGGTKGVSQQGLRKGSVISLDRRPKSTRSKVKKAGVKVQTGSVNLSESSSSSGSDGEGEIGKADFVHEREISHTKPGVNTGKGRGANADKTQSNQSKNQNKAVGKSQGAQLRQGSESTKEKEKQSQAMKSEGKEVESGRSKTVMTSRTEEPSRKPSAKSNKDIAVPSKPSQSKPSPSVVEGNSNLQEVEPDTKSTRPEVTEMSDEAEEEVDIRKADVSIINRQFLPSTLEYLNQRSHGEKFLLNQLRGNRAKNSIEQRLEAAEKRPSLDKVLPKKSVPAVQTVKKKPAAAHLSFDDILGGMDNLGQQEKQRGKKAGKRESVREESVESKQKQKQEKKTANEAEKKTRESHLMQGGVAGERRRPAKESRSDEKARGVKPGSDIGEEKKGKLSEDKKNSSSGKESEDKVESKTYSHSSRLDEGDQLDSAQAEVDAAELRRLRWEQARQLKSSRSQAFDQPIVGFGSSDEDDSLGKKATKSSKFAKQTEHLHDSKSTRGHGRFPPLRSGAPTLGVAFAGKGKGRGKNRNPGTLKQVNEPKSSGTGGGFVPEISASERVTQDEIMQYVDMGENDLGSDFSDMD